MLYQDPENMPADKTWHLPKRPVYHVLKTNRSGSKVAVSSHRGAEVTTSSPQRGHGYVSSSQRGPAVSLSPSQRWSKAASLSTHCSVANYPRSLSPQPGPGLSPVSTSRGTETRPRTETSRPRSPHRKNQSVQTLSSHLSGGRRNVSPMREESINQSRTSQAVRLASIPLWLLMTNTATWVL